MGCGASKEDTEPPVAAAKVRRVTQGLIQMWLLAIGFYWFLLALHCMERHRTIQYASSLPLSKDLVAVFGSRLRIWTHDIRIRVKSVRFLSHSAHCLVHSILSCFFHPNHLYPHYESYRSYCNHSLRLPRLLPRLDPKLRPRLPSPTNPRLLLLLMAMAFKARIRSLPTCTRLERRYVMIPYVMYDVVFH